MFAVEADYFYAGVSVVSQIAATNLVTYAARLFYNSVTLIF